ncbi:MAG: HlyD family secretion protein [Rhodospirillales bacterium]|jgi:RND family efflux transporter MFP subunit|nr:HlyD family secretion protein [Rhodospirillales bacterium]
MTRRIVGIAVTLLLVAIALLLALALWRAYVLSPWTRDGRVRADVVVLAAEVPGPVVQVQVADNQFVHKGDILFTVDPARYRLALAQAEAMVENRRQDLKVRASVAQRREKLSELATSTEAREQARGSAGVAEAALEEAQVAIELAKLNLERTTVRAPVNGWVTNLRLRPGDYAAAGQSVLTLVDADSFWIVGYFEETKLARIRIGDAARATLMAWPDAPIFGHVESIGRGIADPNATDAVGLPAVNPIFAWVRLAQRIPVRIHIDQKPPELELGAGLSCTVEVGADVHRRRSLLERLRDVL